MFREDKTTEMASRFLTLAGGKISAKTLMLMLYAADRRMLVQWENPLLMTSGL